MGLVTGRLAHPFRCMLPECRVQPVAWYYGLTGLAIVGWFILFWLCVHGPRFQLGNQGINMGPKVLKSKGSIFAYPNAKDIGKCNTFLGWGFHGGIVTWGCITWTIAWQNRVKLSRHGICWWQWFEQNWVALERQNAHFICQVKRCILCMPFRSKTAFL